MIGLSSILVDTVGAVVFEQLPKSNINNSTRRVSRIKTLDGGCTIVDSGFTDSDKTLNIETLYNEDNHIIINHLHQDKTLIYISMKTGFYSGVISVLNISHELPEVIKMTILIKEKLS